MVVIACAAAHCANQFDENTFNESISQAFAKHNEFCDTEKEKAHADYDITRNSSAVLSIFTFWLKANLCESAYQKATSVR